MRRAFDFYETAEWQIRALLAEQHIGGVVLEPCVGDGSIARWLRSDPRITRVITNDIDPNREADYHFDAADPALYQCIARELGHRVDFSISNPPYEMPLCTNIVKNAVEHVRGGACMMLRISFREPTAKVNPRGPFLKMCPITRLLTLPRYSFTGNGKSDSATTEWAIWLRDGIYNSGHPILSLYNADKIHAAKREVA